MYRHILGRYTNNIASRGVYKHPQLGYILYYHYADENIGLSRSDFQFGWNYLYWMQDNWPTVCDSPGQN